MANPPPTHRWAITHVSRDPDGSRRLHFVCTAPPGCTTTFSAEADSYLAAHAAWVAAGTPPAPDYAELFNGGELLDAVDAQFAAETGPKSPQGVTGG